MQHVHTRTSLNLVSASLGFSPAPQGHEPIPQDPSLHPAGGQGWTGPWEPHQPFLPRGRAARSRQAGDRTCACQSHAERDDQSLGLWLAP